MTSNAIQTAARPNNALVDALRDQMNKQIVGQKQFVDRLLLGLFGDGHILLEGATGPCQDEGRQCFGGTD